jgi:hypothetical protein
MKRTVILQRTLKSGDEARNVCASCKPVLEPVEYARLLVGEVGDKLRRMVTDNVKQPTRVRHNLTHLSVRDGGDDETAYLSILARLKTPHVPHGIVK